jgi:DNA-binding SARP family transcriptional activator
MGDRAGVERAYQRLSVYLREEFEVEPSPETVELYRDLRGD